MRRFKRYVVIAFALVVSGSAGDGALAEPSVVPLPVEMVVSKGEFTVSDHTQVVASPIGE